MDDHILDDHNLKVRTWWIYSVPRSFGFPNVEKDVVA
jgi:hypothetical protein